MGPFAMVNELKVEIENEKRRCPREHRLEQMLGLSVKSPVVRKSCTLNRHDYHIYEDKIRYRKYYKLEGLLHHWKLLLLHVFLDHSYCLSVYFKELMFR